MGNKIIGLVNRDSYFDNNQAFNPQRTNDFINYGWIDLREAVSKKGYDFITIEYILEAKKCDILIFNEMPVGLNKRSFLNTDCKKVLILYESPLIVSDNYDIEMYEQFDVIFTWDNQLIKRGPKFQKINFSVPIEKMILKNFNHPRTIDAVLVAGNKLVNGKGELYSYRKKLIKSFDKEENVDFQLYGAGWDRPKISSHNLVGKVFNRLTRNISITPPKNWKGKVESKMELYQQCNFSFAIENAFMLDGYITEKILHSILALTKPFYLGDNDIGRYIPSNFYIDLTDLSTQTIVEIIKTTSDDQLKNHRRNVHQFLMDGGLMEFDTKHNAQRICEVIL